VVDESARLGIDACGVCRAEPYVRAEALIRERRAAGLFADMRFTMAHPERSCHPETLLRGARSVVAAARSYARPEPPKPSDRPRGRMPRYTRRDEYAVLREQLAELGARLEGWAPGARSAVFVDANHHVDREAAAPGAQEPASCIACSALAPSCAFVPSRPPMSRYTASSSTNPLLV